MSMPFWESVAAKWPTLSDLLGRNCDYFKPTQTILEWQVSRNNLGRSPQEVGNEFASIQWILIWCCTLLVIGSIQLLVRKLVRRIRQSCTGLAQLLSGMVVFSSFCYLSGRIRSGKCAVVFLAGKKPE